MRKKYKVSLFMIIGLPIVAGIPFVANLYFQPQLIQFTKLSVWFVIAALIPLLSPLGGHRIGGKDAVIKYPLLIWLALVISFIVLIYLLFLTESMVFLNQGSQNYGVNVRHALVELFHVVWLRSIFFPWSLVAAVLVMFVVRSERHNFHPFSHWVPLKIFSLQVGRIMRKGADLYIENSARFFVIGIIAFISFQLIVLFGGNTFHAVPTIVTFFGMILFPYAGFFKRIAHWVKIYSLPPIISFIFIIVFILIFIFLIRTLLSFALPYLDPLTQKMLRLEMPTTVSRFWQPTWKMWEWSWWLMTAPLFASIIVKFSHGRSIRAVVLLILVIPTAVTVLFHFYQAAGDYWLQSSISFLLKPHAALVLQLIAQFLFLLFFMQRSSNHIMYIGYIPIQSPKKIRVYSLRGLWFMAVAFTSAITLRSIYGATMLQVLAAVPLFLILLISIVYRLPPVAKKEVKTEVGH
ncbi:MAG: hypothetical protein GY821_15190 [Gammaproteobacteria bacterium]|nr:hypothetical protein [Gammaproteobacteria bacterium]